MATQRTIEKERYSECQCLLSSCGLVVVIGLVARYKILTPVYTFFMFSINLACFCFPKRRNEHPYNFVLEEVVSQSVCHLAITAI